MWTISNRDRHLLFALFALGLVLKLCWIGNNALAHDEPFTVYWAMRPWAEFRSMLESENNPPLYFMLMRFWANWVPLDPALLRIPSAVSSALAAVPLYLLARQLNGRVAAVASTLIFTLTTYHYGFAHEVRAYSLLTLLSIASIWQLHALSIKRKRALLWLTVLNMLLVYTHFFGWLVIGLQLLLILSSYSNWPSLKRWTLMAAVVLLAYVPYASIFFGRAGESISQGTWLSIPPLEEVYNMLWRWSNAPVIALLFLAFTVVMLIKHARREPALVWGAIWAFTPLVGLYLVSQWIPMFLDRYLVFAAPGWALLVGSSLAMLKGRIAWWATVLTVLAMAFTFTPWKRNGHTPENVVAQVEEWRSAAACAPVLVAPTWYRLTYRFAQDKDRFKNEAPTLLFAPELELGDAQCGTVIVVDASDPDAANDRTQQQLRASHVLVDSVLRSEKVWVKRYLLKNRTVPDRPH